MSCSLDPKFICDMMAKLESVNAKLGKHPAALRRKSEEIKLVKLLVRN